MGDMGGGVLTESNRVKEKWYKKDVQVASELPESFCKQDSKGCNTCRERRPGFF